MTEIVEHRTFPCRECPWQREADLSLFTDDDYDKLRSANAGVLKAVYDPAELEKLRSASGIACHKDQADTEHPLRLCAGWLVVVGRHHLGTRMRIITGALPASAVEAGDDWPALYRDPADLLLHRPGTDEQP